MHLEFFKNWLKKFFMRNATHSLDLCGLMTKTEWNFAKCHCVTLGIWQPDVSCAENG